MTEYGVYNGIYNDVYIPYIYILKQYSVTDIYIYILVRTPPNINLWKIIVVSRWAAAGAK